MKRNLRAAAAWLEEMDGWLLSSVMALCLLGVVMVYNTGSFRPEALRADYGQTYYLVKHLGRFGLGLLALLFLANRDYRILRNRWINWGLLAFGLGMVALTALLPRSGLVDSRAACSRWVQLPFMPVQPVEILKVALVLFLADRCGEGFDRLRERPGRLAWAAGLPPLAAVLLALQPNYGNALVMLVLAVVIFFLCGLPARILAAIAAAVGAAAVGGFFAVDKIHVRVEMWWNGICGQGSSYHVEQSLIGIGAGGWHGFGFGASHQRFWFLPESHTDFIFSVLGEELGLIGGAATLAFFTIFALRGLRIARRAGDGFGRLTAAGLTAMIATYAAINIGMVTGVWPVMGLPLPFVSYGGSALVTNLAAVGILLSIDRRGRRYRALRERAPLRGRI